MSHRYVADMGALAAVIVANLDILGPAISAIAASLAALVYACQLWDRFK